MTIMHRIKMVDELANMRVCDLIEALSTFDKFDIIVPDKDGIEIYNVKNELCGVIEL